MDINSFVIGHSKGYSKGYSTGKNLAGVVSMEENEAGGMSYELKAKDGGTFDIAYGNTAPDDTTKLWVKRSKPDNIQLMSANFSKITTIGTLPTNLGSSGSVVVDSQVYLFGGSKGQDATDTILKYDVATNSITTLGIKLPTKATGIRASLHETNVYLFECVNGTTASIYKFDMQTQIITTINTTWPTSTWGLTVVTVGTKTYIFGGETSAGKLNTIHEFDPETEMLTELETKLPLYMYGMAAGVIGSKVYLLGGAGDTTATGSSYVKSTIYVFDVETKQISTAKTTLPSVSGYPWDSLSSAVVGTSIYIFGGRGTNAVNNIAKFDTKTETVTTLSMTLPATAYRITTAVMGEKVYLLGGMRSNSSATNSILRFVNDIALSKTDMAITAGTLDKAVKLADDVTMGIGTVYSGDEYGIGEKAEAYIYKNGAWTLI